MLLESIDWDLIETHRRDVIRMVASIRACTVLPSTLLRKLGNYSKKNRLYRTFREIGPCAPSFCSVSSRARNCAAG